MSAAETTNRFRQLWDLGFQRIVPVIPPDAPLAWDCKVAPKDRGKTPGMRNEGRTGWNGYTSWCKSWWGSRDVERQLDWWAEMGAGTGIVSGRQDDGTYLVALDADCDDETCARSIDEFIVQQLGDRVPTRIGRDPRRLYFVRCSTHEGWDPLHKKTWTFKYGAFEIFGHYRQSVAFGIHPKTMRPYRWVRDLVAFDQLPIIPITDLEAVLAKLTDPKTGILLECRPGRATSKKNFQDRSKVDQETLTAPSEARLQAVMESMPNSESDYPDYDSWVKLGEFLHAACQGLDDGDVLGLELWMGWCARYDGYKGPCNPEEAERIYGTFEGPHAAGWAWLQARNPGPDFFMTEKDWDAMAEADAAAADAREERVAAEEARKKAESAEETKNRHESDTKEQRAQREADEAIKRAQAEAKAEREAKAKDALFDATPFEWVDPTTIPMRAWLYDRHYIRRFVSTTVAPGGVGKSSLTMVEGVAMATGRNLIGVNPTETKLKVWIFNGEDPKEELVRRILAICIHFDIPAHELEGQLFLDSGLDMEIIVASQTKNGTTIAKPVVDAVTSTIKRRGIDVLIVDPFVSIHNVGENDNGAINAVAKTFSQIADKTNCAIELVHHVRKGQRPGQETTVEDGRGAVALLAKARSARVLNTMSAEEASTAGVSKPRGYFRVDNGKSNMAAPPDNTQWFRLVSTPLDNGTEKGPFGNGDTVAVVEQWIWPDHTEDVTAADFEAIKAVVAAGEYRLYSSAKAWVGKAVAQALSLDLDDKSDKAKVKALIKRLLHDKVLVVEARRDKNGDERDFVVVRS